MELAEIENISTPSHPRDRLEFHLIRALVRRHVAAGRGNWLAHRDIEDALGRRGAEAAARERELLASAATSSLVGDSRQESNLFSARERVQAYVALRAALNHYCAGLCTPPRASY